MKSISSTDLKPMYEEWRCHAIGNSADLNISYKILKDEDYVHEYDVDVLNYGEDFKIKNLNTRLARRANETNQDIHFNHLDLSYLAFTHQDFFIDLFGTNDFRQALESPNFQSNVDVVKMCEI